MPDNCCGAAWLSRTRALIAYYGFLAASELDPTVEELLVCEGIGKHINLLFLQRRWESRLSRQLLDNTHSSAINIWVT